MNDIETAEKIPRQICVAVNEHKRGVERAVLVQKRNAIVAHAEYIGIALLEVAMWLRGIEVGKLVLVEFCPNLAVVIAEHHRPLNAQTLHKRCEHLGRFVVVERTLQEPRHRIDHIPCHHNKVRICVFDDLFNRRKRKFVLFTSAERAADMHVGELQNSERFVLLFDDDFSAVALFEASVHFSPLWANP